MGQVGFVTFIFCIINILGINVVSFDYVVYLIPHVIPFHCKRI